MSNRNIPLMSILVIAFLPGIVLCADEPGSVVVWGRNEAARYDPPLPNRDFIAISIAGSDSIEGGDATVHNCLGLKIDGSIVAWGDYPYSECKVPEPNTGFTAISAGAWHCLALKVDGSVVAWGRNDDGECEIPAPNSGFRSIAAGSGFSLGLKENGSIVGWGIDPFGYMQSWSETDYVAIAAGSSYVGMGLRADGSIDVRGLGFYGEYRVPAPNSDFVAVSAGGSCFLGLKADTSVVAWGTTCRSYILPIPNTGFVAISAGNNYCLGLKADGSIVGWGFNPYGACDVPEPNTGFAAIAAGYHLSMGLRGSVTQTGSLQVTIEPQEAIDAGAKWRRVGTQAWYESGYIETGVPVGECTVEFKDVPGYLKATEQTGTLQAQSQLHLVGSYLYVGSATLSVETTPIAGEIFVDGQSKGLAPWTGIVSPGRHTVGFGPIAGYLTPSDQVVTLADGERKNCIGIYTEVLINVDCNDIGQHHEIDPNIYGLCHADRTMLEDLNITLNRYGGNRGSTYNWRENAYNTCINHYFESLPYPSSEPGAFVDQFISDCRSTGAEPMVTVPTIGWVATLGPNRSPLASYPKSVYPSQQAFDCNEPFESDCAGNGMTRDKEPIYGDPQLAYVPSASSSELWSPETEFQDVWIQHIVTKWGLSNEGGVRYYILDNEPSLWHKTHRDIRSIGLTMDELSRIMIEYASVIKDIDPEALIVGPEVFGWTAYFLSGSDQQYGDDQGWGISWDELPDRSDHDPCDVIPWLLSEFKKAEGIYGHRLLDVLSVHQYPDANEFRHDGKHDDVNRPMQLRRNRSTRRLWDKDYIDEICKDENNNKVPVRLISRLHEWVNDYYPGTKIAITEYSWGAVEHMNGATAQADILGIFGRYGIDMATHWKWPKLESNQPVYQVFKLYRNYDGAGSETSVFGEISVPVSIPDPSGVQKDYRDYISAYAAKRSIDNALTLIVINKDLDKDIGTTVDVYSFVDRATAEIWQLKEPERSIQKLDDIEIREGSLAINLPKQSITLLVIKRSDSTHAFIAL